MNRQSKEILQRALNLLQDKEFCDKYPFVRKGITEDIIEELQRRCKSE